MDYLEYLSYGRWSSKKFLLLLGCSATKEDISALARNNIPITGVLTTSCDENQLEQYKKWLSDYFEVPVSLVNHLNGSRGKNISLVPLMEVRQSSDTDSYFEESDASQEPEFQSGRLQSALLGNAPLWVIGFDRGNSYDDLASRPLLRGLENRGFGTVFFWGTPSTPVNAPLRKYAENKQQSFFEISLADALSRAESEFAEEDSQQEDFTIGTTNDFYYSRGVPVDIDSVEVRRYSATASLLTWNLLSSGSVSGKFEQVQKFQDFLIKSCNAEPQWYGYSSKNPFYVERESVGANLKQLVDQQFEAYSKGKTGEVIALYGPSGSGKSVALANLAYKVFMEKEHPVVFIPGGIPVFSNTSEQFQQLSDLLRMIETRSQKGTCTLLIWDCSSFLDGSKLARELCRNLRNQGRRSVILVYSAYSVNESEKQKTCSLEISRQFFDENEKNRFFEKIERYGGLEKETLDRLQKENEGTNDIFTWLYRALLYMQEALGESFLREKNTVSTYISKTQHKILDIGEKLGPLYHLLKEKGFDVEPEVLAEPSDKDVISYDVYYDNFSFFLALFTLSGQALSENLANIIMSDDLTTDPQELSFAYDNRRQQICSTLLYEIPWVIYRDGQLMDGGSYVFRSSAEAEIFLKQYTDSDIVDRICRLLDVCDSAFLSFDFVPGRDLVNLLRMIGPNTADLRFRLGGQWGNVQKQYNKIIDRLGNWSQHKLDTMERDYTILRLVYAREYYGNILKCDSEKDDCAVYEERLKKLIQCIHDAQDESDMLGMAVQNTPSLQLSLDNVHVELLSCQRRCSDLLAEYDTACYQWQPEEGMNKSLMENFKRYKASYAEAFQWMQSAISRNPWNGYFYIALFHCFQMEFRSMGKQEEQMRRSQEIQLYVDQATSSGESIINRGSNGRDELGEECAKVQNLIDKTFSGFDISIAAIREDRVPDASRKVYQQLMEANSSAGISFVVRQELRHANIDLFSSEKLRPEQIEICRKSLDFIKEQGKQFPLCLDGYYIRFTMLQLMWAIWNEIPFNSRKERQATYFEEDQWRELYRACCDVQDAAIRENVTTSPIFVVVYALCEFQSTKMIRSQTNEMILGLNSMRGHRMFSPYRVTNNKGEDCEYRGTVTKVPRENSPIGKMSIDTGNGKIVANFNRRYLVSDGAMLENNTIFPKLGLSISYRGPQTYSLAKSGELWGDR